MQVSRGGKQVSLGRFVTAEEAALTYARSLEERAAVAAAHHPDGAVCQAEPASSRKRKAEPFDNGTPSSPIDLT